MAAERSPCFLWWPKDHATSDCVSVMSLAQEGAYRRLLDHQWLNLSIPADTGKLARICRCTVPEMEALWPEIAPCFTSMPGAADRLVNPRLESVRREAGDRRARKAAAGALGAAATNGKRAADRSASVRQRVGNGAADRLAEGRLPVPVPVPKEENGATEAGTPAAAGAPSRANGSRRYVPEHPRTLELAEHFAMCIRAWKPDARVSTTSPRSLRELDALLTLDGRDPDRVGALLEWLFGGEPSDYAPEPGKDYDERVNVRSGDSLRRAWDRLEVLAIRRGALP
jgi:uncharacterized protein YdaU (DUF1376 family)